MWISIISYRLFVFKLLFVGKTMWYWAHKWIEHWIGARWWVFFFCAVIGRFFLSTRSRSRRMTNLVLSSFFSPTAVKNKRQIESREKRKKCSKQINFENWQHQRWAWTAIFVLFSILHSMCVECLSAVRCAFHRIYRPILFLFLSEKKKKIEEVKEFSCCCFVVHIHIIQCNKCKVREETTSKSEIS